VVLSFGEFELDAGRNELRRAGEPVDLLPTPLRLLQYLVSHRDRAVPKEELLDALWPDAVVSETALTSALKHLRKALGDDGTRQEFIRTQRRHGIRFVFDVEERSEELAADPAPAPGHGVRRLAAVLSADVVGYSRLVAEDEARTVAELRAALAAMESAVVASGGRVVDAVGDNLLAEFPSGIPAVEAALEIQGLGGSAVAAEPPRLRFRIGVHLGEVLAEGARIYGDTVNLAARIEALAPPGGIAASEAVVEALRGRLPLQWGDGSERTLKNIARPVRVYGLGPDGSGGLASAGAAGARPVLAVLPFLNLSSDPEQEFLADGLTEDLTTLLARTGVVDVIARTSTFAFKEKARDVRAIGSELGARYLVEGSVRRGGNRLRVTVQLVDGESGAHHFAEKYDRPLEDLFDLQDDLTEQIVAQIPGVVRQREAARCERVAPEQLDTWALFHRAYDAFYLRSQQLSDLAEARDLVERALAREPDFAPALALRAVITILPASAELVPDAEERRRSAVTDGRRALERAPDDPFVVRSWATVLRNIEGSESSIPVVERALALNPSDAQGWASLGIHVAQSGRPAEGQPHIERAIRLSPCDPMLWTWQQFLANVLLQQGKHAEALAAVERSLSLNPASPVGRATRAALFVRVGREAEAQAQIAALKADFPQISLAIARAVLGAGAPGWAELHEEILDLLARAGLD
jgi:adenylate cyclase